MKMKTKIVIAFFAIIIFPISIMFLMFMSLTYLQIQDIQSSYGVELDGYEALSNPVRFLSRQATDIFAKILDTIEKNPDLLEEPSLEERINEALLEQNSYLIVRKADTLIFRGKDEESQLLEWYLPKYGESSRDMNGGKYVASEQVLVRSADFIFEDGMEGSVFVVTQVDEMIPQLRRLFILVLATIIVIMIMTAIAIVVWLYRSVVHPLQNLQKGVNEIKRGNLEFEIMNQDTNTEIGQLCIDFDEMRKKLKHSNEEMERNNKETRELVANISHDLKTPITSVLGYIEGIKDGVADTPEKMNRYRTIIYNKVLDMDRLINQLDIYAKIDTNRIQYQFQVINISEYFSDCVEEIGMDLQTENIELTYYDYTNKDILINADPEQLRRVVNNIISNSVKYMDKEKGFITIYIKDMGEEVLVELADNGKGIAQEDVPKIFERFYRTDASRNSAQGGSGIGLSIVQKIIEDHGGRLWATSREKKGTTIYFALKKCTEK